MCGCSSPSISCCRNLGLGASQLSAGIDGAQVYFGTTVPLATLGRENDVYINTTITATAYKKILGVWVLQGLL